jgi:hypothetical protein
MNFWEFLNNLFDRLPGWPSEKQLVMLTTFGMGASMLAMAGYQPSLWDVELFKTLITVVIVTGCINMILAFYFTANKSDEKRIENTGAAFQAISDTANAVTGASTTTTNEGNNTLHDGDIVAVEKLSG